MELLLNVVWLTLALPAIWVWRHQPVRARYSPDSSRLRASLLLLCLLMLLFPVVSATDDMHPMRPEMEESNPFKRLVKHSNSSASSAGWSHLDNFVARLSSDFGICRSDQPCALAPLHSFIIPELVACGQRDSRAPPSSLLG